MPPVPTRAVGSPIWIELTSGDLDESARFYEGLLGLSAAIGDPAFAGYRNLLAGSATIGGLMTKQPDLPDAWVVYLLAPDLDELLDRVPAHGGTVTMGAQAAGDLGRMAFVQDPSGAGVGLWEPATFPGTALENEPGTPCWYELHARSHYAETVAFYETVLGWTAVPIGDTDDFRMVVQGDPANSRAGIYDASSADEGDSAWHVYFTVADADAAAESIVRLGGRVLDGPTDTPYGRLVHATDATGATVDLMRLPER